MFNMQEQVAKLRKGFFERQMAPARKIALDKVKEAGLQGDIYTWGCAAGYSQVWIYQYLKELNIFYNNFHIFDGWVGLPVERTGLAIEASWTPGAYSTKDEFGCPTIDDAVKLSKEFFKTFGLEGNCIVGFYEESLPKLDIAQFKPAIMTDVDVDLMCSTETLLEWMTQNKLLISGSIIHYDDFLSVDETKGGEGLAHNNWINKYDIKGELTKICGGVIFEIEKI